MRVKGIDLEYGQDTTTCIPKCGMVYNTSISFYGLRFLYLYDTLGIL